MAKMVGVWIWVWPRQIADAVNLTVGGTVILTEEDVARIGDEMLLLGIRIMDRDPGPDDKVDDVSDTFAGPFNVGPNSFQIEQITVPHDDVANSEPGTESVAELYVKAKVKPATVTHNIQSNWAESQTEHVRFAE
jgi:hypothetical protein